MHPTLKDLSSDHALTQVANVNSTPAHTCSHLLPQVATASLSLVPPPLISSCALTLGRQGIGELGPPLEPVHLAEQPIRYGCCGTDSGIGCYYMPFTLDTIDFPSGCPLQMRKDMVTLLLMGAAKIASPPAASDGGGGVGAF